MAWLTLIRLEVAMALRERRLAVALGVVAAVLAGAGAVALITGEQARQDRAAVSARERGRWLGQGEKDPHSAAHYSIYAFKPVLPLAALDPGIEPFVGEAVWLEAHLQNDLVNRPMQESSEFERAGLADPAGLFTRFAPLLVFLLAFAAVARDREQGTLGLSLSLAGSGRPIAAVKTIGVALTSAAALTTAPLVVGLAGVAMRGADGDAVLRLAAWGAVACAYIAALSLIGVLTCLHAPSPRAGLGTLFVFWLIVVLGALPGASAAATYARPLPSFQAMKIVLDRDAAPYWTPEVGAERRAALMARYGAASEAELDELQVNLRGLELDFAEREAQRVFDREIGGFYGQAVSQDRFYARLGWLSPAVAFDAASSALAGTDFVHHLTFIDAAERYRRDLVNRMNADLIPNPTVNGVVHTNNATLWFGVPAFTYQPPEWGGAWRAAAMPVLALAAWVLAAGALAAWSTARLRP